MKIFGFYEKSIHWPVPLKVDFQLSVGAFNYVGKSINLCSSSGFSQLRFEASSHTKKIVFFRCQFLLL